MSNLISKAKQFYSETVQETKKSSWPNRPELMQTTFLIIVAVLILTAFVFVIDLIFSKCLMAIYEIPHLFQ